MKVEPVGEFGLKGIRRPLAACNVIAAIPPSTWIRRLCRSSRPTISRVERLAFEVIPNVVIGAGIWYLRHDEGLAVGVFTGDAVYLGPTFFWKISPIGRLADVATPQAARDIDVVISKRRFAMTSKSWISWLGAGS